MNNESLQQQLDRMQPVLTPVEQDALFARIEANLSSTAVVSPYQTFSIFSKPMSYLALFLVLLLGTSGTVAASESARPGDLLFPIERATEQLRLVLASDDKKTELENRFLDERFAELATLVDESTLTTTATATDDFLRSSSTVWLATSSVSFEADVFTDITIVKVEVADAKAYFTTSTSTRPGVVASIAERYGLDPVFVDSRLNLEVEDRTSRSTDFGRIVSVSGEERIATAIAILLGQASTMDDASTSDRLRALLADVEDIMVEGRGTTMYTADDVRIKVSDKRVEVRTDTERIRLEDKNGEVRIKYDSDDDDNGFGNDDSDDRGHDDDDRDLDDDKDTDRDDDDNSRVSSTSVTQALEVEADVFSDITLVKVELNDRTTTFTMSASSSREAVVSEVARRYSLTETQVAAVLDYEVENRASRPQDSTDTDDRDRDDDMDDDDDDRNDDTNEDQSRSDDTDDKDEDDKDDKDKDEDDDRDEDNSGHGGGDDDDRDRDED